MTTIKPLVDNLFKKMVAGLYPFRCLQCGRAGSWLCLDCYSKLPTVDYLSCPVCRRPAIDGFTHPGCQGRYTPDRLLAFFPYADPIRRGIKLFKYRRRATLAPFLASLMVEQLQEQGVSFGAGALLVPVPLYWYRQWLRGFNQSGLLAQSLGTLLGLEVVINALTKVKNTPSQTECTRKERGDNVRGSIEVNPLYRAKLFGKDLILVDDVFTTGSTLKEATRVLKKAGVRYVYLLTVARD